MEKVYIEDLKNEELTSQKTPKKALIDSILNFSKSYKVTESKHIGQLKVVLN